MYPKCDLCAGTVEPGTGQVTADTTLCAMCIVTIKRKDTVICGDATLIQLSKTESEKWIEQFMSDPPGGSD